MYLKISRKEQKSSCKFNYSNYHALFLDKQFNNNNHKVTVMDNMNEDLLTSDKIQAEVEKKVKELKGNDEKIKKVYPIVVLGNEDDGEKPYYVGYFKQPSFPAFSKYLALSQKDQAGAMRELAKDCFLDGDKELIKDDSLFIYGLMPHLAQLIEVRQGKVVNLSKAGK